jgi:hypothetical protein
VAALVHLGRNDKAKEAAARFLEIQPGFRISGWMNTGKGQTHPAALVEGIRLAGLPE